MSNLSTLIKVNLRESLDKRKFKENKKQQAFLVYVLLIGLLFIGISTVYSVIYGMMYVEAGLQDKLFELTLVFITFTTFMTFSSSISKMQSIFLSNDLDILQSLPVKRRDIILSKIINLYVIELLICLVLLVPNSIVSTILSGDLKYLLIMPMAFILPSFPMLVALLITALLELLIKNQKVKNVISAVFMILVFVGIFVLSFVSNFSQSSHNVSAFSSVSSVAKYINPSIILLTKGLEENILWLLLFVFANLALLVIVLSIISAAFNKIHNNMLVTKLNSQSKSKSKNTNLTFRTQTKQFWHMTVKQFFRSKNSVIQTFLGIFMSVAFGVIVSIAAKFNLFTVTDDGGNTINVFELMYSFIYIIAIGLTIFSSIMPPASVAVSLEGRNLFTLKSLPVDFKKYLIVKLLFSYMIMVIPSFIVSVIIVILVEQSIFSMIITLLFPIIFNFFISCYTLIINSAFPYLTWKQEIEVFKYHKSTIITVFTDMGISMLSIGVVIALMVINVYLAGIAILAIFTILSIVLYLVLIKKSAKRLANLEISE